MPKSVPFSECTPPKTVELPMNSAPPAAPRTAPCTVALMTQVLGAVASTPP